MTKIIRSKRKTISITVKSNNIVEVKAPLHTSDTYIKSLLNKKKSWIDKCFCLNKKREHFLKSGKIMFLGKEFFLYKYMCEKNEVLLKNDTIFLHFKKNPNLYLQNWYKVNARKMFTKKLEYFSKKFSLPFEEFRLTSAKKRWGSCSIKKNINLSWHLIKAPEYAIDYVIIHELTHTKIMNHSKKFWMAVQKNCPNYKIYQKWFKDNIHLLD